MIRIRHIMELRSGLECVAFCTQTAVFCATALAGNERFGVLQKQPVSREYRARRKPRPNAQLVRIAQHSALAVQKALIAK